VTTAEPVQPVPATGRAADPGERGSTEIRPAAVRRVVAAAVSEVADTAEVRRHWGRSPTDVRAKVSGTRVTGTVRVAVRYPTSVRGVDGRIRERVADQLRELCGLDVTVVGLVGEPARARVE
jgi:uncharacterized alkaline shock family protein YloU